MSRIGKKPIPLPQGVKVAIEGQTVRAEGPKGKLSQTVPDSLAVTMAENVLTVSRSSDHRTVRALHGLMRSLIANMVHGVKEGFERKLEIVGIGCAGRSRPSGVDHSQGLGQGARGTDGGEDPGPPQARSVQGQGHQVRRRAYPAQGRQEGGSQVMGITSLKVEGRNIRHLRVRTKVQGTAARPRLAVFRSLNHIYAQVVDDATGRTLVAVDSRSADFRGKAKSGGNVAAAKIVGELVAQKAKASGIGQVVFDRGGYQYHGRVKALAEAARAAGLAF